MGVRQKLVRIGLVILISVLAYGCAGGKDSLLPQDGPTMKEVYDDHFKKSRQRDDARAEVSQRGIAGDPGLEDYTRSAATEVEGLFPRLPNPDLVMYMFPHLSEQGYPVPGYSTTFSLYDRVEYALPGEAEGWRK